MITLSALQSVAVVLIALLLLLAGGNSVQRILAQSSEREALQLSAHFLAGDADAFYRSVCEPGSRCEVGLPVPSNGFHYSVEGGVAVVSCDAGSASSAIFAPAPASQQTVYGGRFGNWLLLGWE